MPKIAQTGVIDQDPYQDRDHGRRGSQGYREELRISHAT